MNSKPQSHEVFAPRGGVWRTDFRFGRHRTLREEQTLAGAVRATRRDVSEARRRLAPTLQWPADPHRDLKAQGVRFKSEPIEITAGPHQGGYGVYFSDPDGYTIELHQPRRG